MEPSVAMKIFIDFDTEDPSLVLVLKNKVNSYSD